MTEFEPGRESVNEKASRIVKSIFRNLKESKIFLPLFKETDEAALEEMCPSLTGVIVELINEQVKPNSFVVKQRVLKSMFNFDAHVGSPETFFRYQYRDLGSPDLHELSLKILAAIESNW